MSIEYISNWCQLKCTEGSKIVCFHKQKKSHDLCHLNWIYAFIILLVGFTVLIFLGHPFIIKNSSSLSTTCN